MHFPAFLFRSQAEGFVLLGFTMLPHYKFLRGQPSGKRESLGMRLLEGYFKRYKQVK